jgi:hypothetical protein
MSANSMAQAVKAAGESAGHSFQSGFISITDDIPRVLEAAFTGGGGLAGAFNSIGIKIGKGLGDSIVQSDFGGSIADKIGGLFNVKSAEGAGAVASGFKSILEGGIGGAINYGVGLLTKWLSGIGGPSKQEIGARQAFADLYKSDKDALEQVSKAYAAVGLSSDEAAADVQNLLNATHVSADAVAAAMKTITDKEAAAAAQAKVLATAVDGVVSAGKNIPGGLTANLRSSIEALLKMKGVTADEQAALQGLLDSSQADFDKLDQIAKKYGDNLAGLGPKFAQGDLDHQAAGLYDDFQQLVNGGATVGGTLDLMKDKWNEYAQQALSAGATIPETLKPIIQNLIDAGVITDENGNKLTDLSQFTFADTPLSTGIDNLAKAIQDLTNLLANGPNSVVNAINKTGQAANGLPDNPYANWRVPDSGLPAPIPVEGASTGGLMTTKGLQHFGGGGVVQAFGQAPSSLVRTSGTDTQLAMLTPQELVITEGQTGHIGDTLKDALALAAAGKGEAVEIYVIRPDQDDPETIWEALPERVKHNRAGLRTKLVQALA